MITTHIDSPGSTQSSELLLSIPNQFTPVGALCGPESAMETFPCLKPMPLRMPTLQCQFQRPQMGTAVRQWHTRDFSWSPPFISFAVVFLEVQAASD